MIHNPSEALQDLAQRAKALRLYRNLTQAELAERVGVGVATMKRFEKTGAGSIDMLVKIAFALSAEEGVEALFPAPKPASIDELQSLNARRKRASGSGA